MFNRSSGHKIWALSVMWYRTCEISFDSVMNVASVPKNAKTEMKSIMCRRYMYKKVSGIHS